MWDRSARGSCAGARRPTGPLAPPPSSAWFTGTDGSGSVAVGIDGLAVTARVQVRGTSSALIGARLAEAVLEASAAALSTRAREWADAAIRSADPGLLRRPGAPPTGEPPVQAAGGETAALLAAAVRELAEFERQLARLRAATRTVTGAGGRVRATVSAGQITELTLDRAWSARVGSAELEQHLAAVLTAALRLIANTPEQALGRCPAVAAVLARTGNRPPPSVPVPLPSRGGAW